MSTKKDDFNLAIEHIRKEIGPEALKELDREEIVKLVFRTSKKTFEDKNPKIVIVGATGVGKSAIFNALFGEKLVPEACRADVTDKIGKIKFPSGLIMYDTPGVGGPSDINENITRAFLRLKYNSACKKVNKIPVCDLGSGEKCPYYSEEKYGMVSKNICKKRRCTKYSELKLKSAENSDFDLIIFVLDVEPAIRREEINFYKAIAKKYEGIMLIGNKIDLLTDEQKEQKLEYYYEQNLDVIAISAKNESDILKIVEQMMMRLSINCTRIFNTTLNKTLKKTREELIVNNLKIFQAKAASTMVNEQSETTRGPAIIAIILGMCGWMINIYKKEGSLDREKENVKALAKNMFSDIQVKKKEEIVQYEERVERFFETVWVDVGGGDYALERGVAGSLFAAILGGLLAGPLGAIIGFLGGGGLGAASGAQVKKPKRKIRKNIPRERRIEVPIGVETHYKPGGYEVIVLIYSFCVAMKDVLDKLEDLEISESLSEDFGKEFIIIYQQGYQDFISVKEQVNDNNNWRDIYEYLSNLALPYERILKTKKEKVVTGKLKISDLDEMDVGLYIKGINEAINIYNTGEPRTGIAVLGRTLEEAIDDYLKIANKQKKIKLAESKRKGMSFDSKINWLGSEKLITLSEKAKIMALKWDRNIGSHPKSDYEIEGVNKTSTEMMGIGAKMIESINKKISKFNNKEV